MSITQAKRVLEYRERIGSFSSIDDLDVIPGFPEHFRADLKHQIVV
jgi:DNA uptake protein ComE-like DNA-binding protein